MQTLQRPLQFGLVGYFHQHGGRAENFFLQQRIAVEQQADVGLEQLRLRLIALLFAASQVADVRMRVQRLHALGVAGQRAGVEHGLRRLVGHQRTERFDEMR